MTSPNSVLPGVPLVESPLFPSLVDSLGFDEDTKRIALDLHVKGYAVIQFPDPDFDVVADKIVETLAPRFDLGAWRQQGWKHNAGPRVQDVWDSCPGVRRLATNKNVQDLLSRIYGRRAFPFQTLNFPVGTQQHYHTDAVHFSSVPERFMCGVWVALENIGEDAGPLVYYPGSQRLPIFTNEHLSISSLETAGAYDNYPRFEEVWRALVHGLGLKAERFCPRKGEALIWAANLLHGGDRQNDPTLTRWSQVTHYYFDDCAYYTPLMSDAFRGSILFRTGLVDIGSGKSIPNRYAGQNIPDDILHTMSRARHVGTPQLPPDFDPDLYLAANPDVKAAGVDAATHYLNFGRGENRKLRPSKHS